VKSTNAVGIFPDGVSPYGCHEMAGNVKEWCATKYGKPYPYQIENEWTKDYLSNGNNKISRGGDWYEKSNFLHAAYRGYYEPNERSIYIGFRCFVVPIF